MNVIKPNRKRYNKGNRDPYYQSSNWKRLKKQAEAELPTTCPMCKAEGVIKEGDVWDHIKQRALGGKDEISNLRKLCFHHDAVNRAIQSNRAR
jgi:5-methylcytosine-specific restriction endonuclease McrA